jgi:cytidylate kinase
MRKGKSIVVAIDGPAGSGKSTIARLAARRLGFQYLDTGAMYRVVTLFALRRGADPADGESLAELARELDFRFENSDNGLKVFVNGEDVSSEIRGPDVDRWVSLVSSHREVRGYLVGLQREMGRSGGIVCEGRDIGTVVFPQAPVKFYVTATPEVRAGRRKDQLGRVAEKISAEEIKSEMERRDGADSSRELSPLSRAPDAIVIDTTQLTIEEEVTQVVEAVRRATARAS